MSTSITPFDFEGRELRFVNEAIVAADLASALGYRDAANLTRTLDEDEKGTQMVSTPGGEQQMTVITEAGFYRACLNRQVGYVKDEQAREFVKRLQRFVTHEVLPSIRKRGGYLTPEAAEAALTDPDFIIRLATDLKTERAKVAELTPKAEAFDGFISTTGDLSLNEAAKEIARTGVLTGEKRLRDALLRWGWMYRDQQGKPRAYQAQVDCGRLAEKAQWHYHPETGEKVLDAPQVRMTAKGMEAARQRLTKGDVA